MLLVGETGAIVCCCDSNTVIETCSSVHFTLHYMNFFTRCQYFVNYLQIGSNTSHSLIMVFVLIGVHKTACLVST